MLARLLSILCRWYYGQLSDLYHSYKHNGEQGRYLALSATFTTVFAAFGYLIGGFARCRFHSVDLALQSGVLILCGMLFAICLRG